MFKDLQENVEALEEAGYLRRVSEPINKDTELMPLVRCQFRGLPEDQRTGWLFDNVTDSRGREFDMPVGTGLLGSSREIYRFNLGVDTDAELTEKWENAFENLYDPEIVNQSSAPVKDVISSGEELEGEGNGIDGLPVPVSTPGLDPAPFLTSAFVITKDPESGITNMGTYRCQLKSPTEFSVWFQDFQDIQQHIDKARERGEPLEAAVVLGAPPHVSMVSVSKVPSHTDELAVSGGLIDQPLEVVDCETVDLQVPAHSELVLEGHLSHDKFLEGPFGEFTGYIGGTTETPHFDIQAITRRENPIHQAFVGQMPPSESSMIRKIGFEQSFIQHLQNTNITDVKDVVLHESGATQYFVVVQLEKNTNTEPWQAMHAIHGYTSAVGKFTIAVDEDIDPYDLESIIWAMCFRVEPKHDIKVEDYRISPLDPTTAPFDAPHDEKEFPGRTGSSAVLIDATRPWEYPPISLPKQEYMEAALDRWEDLGFDDLELTHPWYGYELGVWPDEFDEAAQAAVEGNYFDYDDIVGDTSMNEDGDPGSDMSGMQ